VFGIDRTIQSDNVDLVVASGRVLWDDIYKPFAEKLYNKLASYHPDFICECILDQHVASRLSLRGYMRQSSQIYKHVFRNCDRNLGATTDGFHFVCSVYHPVLRFGAFPTAWKGQGIQ
jgi:hypothetical protein